MTKSKFEQLAWSYGYEPRYSGKLNTFFLKSVVPFPPDLGDLAIQAGPRFKIKITNN
jgi:hypothetical protein